MPFALYIDGAPWEHVESDYQARELLMWLMRRDGSEPEEIERVKRAELPIRTRVGASTARLREIPPEEYRPPPE